MASWCNLSLYGGITDHYRSFKHFYVGLEPNMHQFSLFAIGERNAKNDISGFRPCLHNNASTLKYRCFVEFWPFISMVTAFWTQRFDIISLYIQTKKIWKLPHQSVLAMFSFCFCINTIDKIICKEDLNCVKLLQNDSKQSNELSVLILNLILTELHTFGSDCDWSEFSWFRNNFWFNWISHQVDVMWTCFSFTLR